MIYNLKEIYWKTEASFGEEYVSDVPRQQIRVSKFKASPTPEKLATTYLNVNREMGETTSTGRVTGEMSFTKNIDKGLIKHHADLIESSLGQIKGAVDSIPVTGNSLVSGKVQLTVGTDWIAYVGHPVTIQFADDVSNINIISDADATSLELLFPITQATQDLLDAGGIINVFRRPFVELGNTLRGRTFQFVELFDDNTVSVFRGAGATAKFNFNIEGKAEIDFEVKSAKQQSMNDSETAMLSPLNLLAVLPELENKMIIYNFNLSYVSDKNAVLTSKCPQMFELEVANELIKESSQCGLNNIISWYAKGGISAKCKWRYNDVNSLFFTRKDENSNDTSIFFSQKDVGFYSYANFTNRTHEDNNGFDSLSFIVDVNTKADWIPMFIPPVELV